MTGKPRRSRRGLSEERQPYAPQTAKLFWNGRSQAVRLPKDCRFEGDEVYVRRDGKSVVLTPKETPREEQWKDFFDALDMFDPTFKFERHQPQAQPPRKSIEAWASPRRRRSKKRS